MVSRRIAAVIFDLDGTLVDSLPGIAFAAEVAWAAVQPGPPCPALRPLIGPPIREMFRRALPAAEVATLDALERAFRAAYDADGWRRTTVYPGVIETLIALTTVGIRCFGVTNKPSLPTGRILSYLGLQPYFVVFWSPDSRPRQFKSKVEVVSALLEQYDLKPGCTLLVGDTEDDIRAAQELGLPFGVVEYGYGRSGFAASLPQQCRMSEFAVVLDIVSR